MFNFKRLSKQQQKALFDQLMEEGWKTRGYVAFRRQDGYGNCCALGVVEDVLGIGWRTGNGYIIEDALPAVTKVVCDIARASNSAGNKEDAIKAVKAIQW